jgi:hypothetical protein
LGIGLDLTEDPPGEEGHTHWGRRSSAVSEVGGLPPQ